MNEDLLRFTSRDLLNELYARGVLKEIIRTDLYSSSLCDDHGYEVSVKRQAAHNLIEDLIEDEHIQFESIRRMENGYGEDVALDTKIFVSLTPEQLRKLPRSQYAASVSETYHTIGNPWEQSVETTQRFFNHY